MAEKSTQLSIVIRTVDQATAKIKAINERLDAATKPIHNFKEALGELKEKSGLSSVAEGFKGVGEAVKETLFKFLEIGVVVGEAVHLVLELVDKFEVLGKTAERVGVSVDFLAGMRDAAERSGASIEALDSGLQAFNQSLGQARAGTGRMRAFLEKVSPALERQLVAAKNNEAAFDLLAGAMAKIEDPAKRAALAQKTLGDAALAPLFAKGPKALKELRDHYLKLAGSQKDAAEAAGETHEAMLDLKASTDGVKAAIVEGLAPALTVIIKQLTEWLQGHRADIKEWVTSLGKKLPDAFGVLVGAFKSVINFIRPFVDSSTKLKVVAGVLAAVILGPLVSSIYALGVALLTTPVGWIVSGIAAIAIGAYELIKHWDGVKGFFVDLWDAIKAKFGWAADLIAVVVFPFIAIPLEIIGHWDSIKNFFADLWKGVMAVFQKAWEFIKGIVDNVIGAVKAVIDAAGSIGKSISIDDMRSRFLSHGAPSSDVSGQSLGAMSASRSSSTEARVTVDFANAPRGTRVRTDPQSTADVDLSVGYQMGAAL